MIDADTKADAMRDGHRRAGALVDELRQHAGRYGLTGHEEAVLVLSVAAHIGRLLIERATRDFLALAERLRSPRPDPKDRP